MQRLVGLVMLCGLFLSGSVLVQAEETEQLKYYYGTVSEVKENQIVVKEYDFDKDEEVDVVYSTNAETQINNAASLSEIVKEDTVEIYYEEKDAQKIAKVITKEIPSLDDETDEGVAEENPTAESLEVVVPEAESVAPAEAPAALPEE